jgi:ABC-type sugar transport system ATPase subunit
LASEASEIVIQAEGISKSFGVIRALQDMNIEVMAGSVHAVIGHNGAGKSTLMNILSGIHPPDSGRLLLQGKGIRFHSPRDALDRGISMVHQELSIVPDLDVGENIFLGREPMTALNLVDRRALYDQADDLLARLGLDLSAQTPCSALSVGARQIIEIARAVSRDCKVLILDEPTSALTDSEQQRLFESVNRLKAHRIAILYVSHKLDEIRMLSDTVTVMRDGRCVTTLATTELDHARMVELMVGHAIVKGQVAAPPQGEVGLELRAITSEDAGIHDVTLSVHRGEILGLAGMLGSGRTELFEILFGIRRLDRGSIRLHGREIQPSSPVEAMTLGIALVPEDRRSQGIFSGISVWKNAVFASFYDVFRTTMGFVRQGLARSAVNDEVNRFKILTPSINQEVQFLSGGNQQKLVLARWLLRRPILLLLDDPTAGIDVGAKGEIHNLVRGLAKAGLTVIVSSSEFAELLGLCHRILVIRSGRIVREVDPRTATEALLVHAASANAEA